MFDAVPIEIRTFSAHGGFVLLESFDFDRDAFRVRVRAAGSDGVMEFRFFNTIGLTMKEDLFGCDGGQVTHEDISGGSVGGATGRSFLYRSDDSATMEHIRKTVPLDFRDSVANHQHFVMSLREFDLSFVAERDFEQIAVAADETDLGEKENAH